MDTPIKRSIKYGAFGAPSASRVASPDDISRYGRVARPFVGGSGDAVYGESNNYAGISGLLFVCRPTQVAGFVMTVIINAIQGVVRGRAWPCMIEKLFKGLEPKFHTTSAVLRISGVVRVGASVLCGLIYVIFRRVRHTVNRIQLTPGLFVPASARSGRAFRQPTSAHYDDGFAFAETQPLRPFSRVTSGVCQDGQAIKSLTCKVFDSGVGKGQGEGNFANINLSHSSLLFSGFWLGLVGCWRSLPSRFYYTIDERVV